MKIRNVNTGRGYELEEDAFEGLKAAVSTNRTYLSLEYVTKILEGLVTRLDAVEAELKTAKGSGQKPAVKTTAKKAASTKDEAANDES